MMAAAMDEYRELQQRVLAFLTHSEGCFSDLAAAVYAFQFRWNAPYQKFCRMRGFTDQIERWEEIPTVPQQAFKQTVLTTFPIETTTREFRTSGTTGEGYGSHYFADLTFYDAAIDKGWAKLSLPRWHILVLGNSPEEAPHSSLSYMFGRLAGSDEKKFYLRQGRLEEERLCSDLASHRKPVILMGTALAFFNLMEKLETALPLADGSLLLETGGYKGSGRSLSKNGFYEQLGEFFSIESSSMINEYGMTELSSQFYSRGLDQVHWAGPWIRHRVVHPLTGEEVSLGEMGVLQLFDLANVGSVMALQTEDLAIKKEDGFILLGRDPAAIERGCSRSVDDLFRR